MKRKASMTMGRASKKMKGTTPSILNLPDDLIIEVLIRVAAASFMDIFNTKISCKTFKKLAEDTRVYQHVSLDIFPIVVWTPLTEKKQAFLMRCAEVQNPEIWCRQAVLSYFKGAKLESGVLSYIERAQKSNYMGASYLLCIIRLFSGNNEMKKEGVKWLSNIKRYEHSRNKLKFHRDKLAKWLREIWIDNPDLRQDIVFCTREDCHKRKRVWSYCDAEEDLLCEGCNVDSEIHFLRKIFPR